MARAGAAQTATDRGGRDMAARLAAIGLRSDWDFVFHLPLRYEDETIVVPIDALREGGESQIEATVTAADVVFRGRRQLHVTVQDESGTLVLRFLHFYPSQLKQLAVGQRIRAFGAARGGLAGMEMVHPRVRSVRAGEALPNALTPIYPTTAGVPQGWLRRRIARALRDVELRDLLPDSLRERCSLEPLRPGARAPAPSAAGRRCGRAGRPHRPRLASAEVRRTGGAADRAAPGARGAPEAARAGVAVGRADGTPAGGAAVRADRGAVSCLERDRARPGTRASDATPGAGGRGQRQDRRGRARGRARDRVRLAGGTDGTDRAARRAALRPHRAVARAARGRDHLARRPPGRRCQAQGTGRTSRAVPPSSSSARTR